MESEREALAAAAEVAAESGFAPLDCGAGSRGVPEPVLAVPVFRGAGASLAAPEEVALAVDEAVLGTLGSGTGRCRAQWLCFAILGVCFSAVGEAGAGAGAAAGVGDCASAAATGDAGAAGAAGDVFAVPAAPPPPCRNCTSRATSSTLRPLALTPHALSSARSFLTVSLDRASAESMVLVWSGRRWGGRR